MLSGEDVCLNQSNDFAVDSVGDWISTDYLKGQSTGSHVVYNEI